MHDDGADVGLVANAGQAVQRPAHGRVVVLVLAVEGNQRIKDQKVHAKPPAGIHNPALEGVVRQFPGHADVLGHDDVFQGRGHIGHGLNDLAKAGLRAGGAVFRLDEERAKGTDKGEHAPKPRIASQAAGQGHIEGQDAFPQAGRPADKQALALVEKSVDQGRKDDFHLHEVGGADAIHGPRGLPGGRLVGQGKQGILGAPGGYPVRHVPLLGEVGEVHHLDRGGHGIEGLRHHGPMLPARVVVVLQDDYVPVRKMAVVVVLPLPGTHGVAGPDQAKGAQGLHVLFPLYKKNFVSLQHGGEVVRNQPHAFYVWSYSFRSQS